MFCTFLKHEGYWNCANFLIFMQFSGKIFDFATEISAEYWVVSQVSGGSRISQRGRQPKRSIQLA